MALIAKRSRMPPLLWRVAPSSTQDAADPGGGRTAATAAGYCGLHRARTRTAVAARPDRGPRTSVYRVVITAAVGKAGVGKTTLAVHAAHQMRTLFPDGQLYVNLRGVEAQALDPSDVLGRFLRALGVDGQSIPDDVDERADLYRSLMADRHALVLLDNAADEAQIRPLLPAGAGNAVLVTSRTRLTGLAGTEVIDLDGPPAGAGRRVARQDRR